MWGKVWRRFASTSIAERLGALFLISNTATLLLAVTGFLIILIVNSLTSYVQELRSITLLLASTSRAAVAFADPAAAERTLGALRERRNISSAYILDKRNGLFTQYGVPPESIGAQSASEDKLFWSWETLTVREAIVLDGERIGSIILVAKLSPLYHQLLLIFGITVLVGSIVAFTNRGFLRLVQRQVVAPIQNLQLLAQTVSVTKDFSQRLQATHDFEINELIHAFNHMLAQLEERDRMLVLAKERAESADLAKSMFVASMSHEFRTPLHAILGMTSEALTTNLSDEQRELIETVRTAGDSLLSLINDVLDLSRIEAGKLVLNPQIFELREFVAKTIGMFQHLYTKQQLSLSYSIDPSCPAWVLADSGRLSQILINFLGNAAKFTPSGGAVVVSVKNRAQLEKGSFQLHWSVSDTGIGIPSDKISSIFDSFSQVQRPGKVTQGTGLGLSIVERLVKLMGGWVWVDSVVDKGSVFHFVIDVQVPKEGEVNAAAKRTASEAESSPAARPQISRRILVVEDNPVNQKLAVRILERGGYSVCTAQHGAECLKILQTQKVDLILMDVSMPVMDGLEASRAIRLLEQTTGEHVPIVALTASVTPEDADSCIDAGMDAFLMKPLSRERLLKTLEDLLANEGGVDTEKGRRP